MMISIVRFVTGAWVKTFPMEIDNKYTQASMRYIFMIMFHLNKDENTQVSGMVMLVDCKDSTMRTLRLFSNARDITKVQVYNLRCFSRRLVWSLKCSGTAMRTELVLRI